MNLRILEDNGIVQIRLCGRIRFCRLAESPQTRAIQEVLETWETTDKSN
jgi:hypothetical protein